MNQPLAKSAFFSLGVHLLILLPGGFLPPTGSESAVDVVRGTSSVELELVAPAPPAGEAPAEPKLPVAAPAGFLDEGVSVDWKSLSLKNPPPRYPLEARVRGWQGTVVVRAQVLPSGQVGSLQVQQTSGHAILDQVAIASVRGWKFQPARRQGTMISSWVEIPISFRLQTDPQQ